MAATGGVEAAICERSAVAVGFHCGIPPKGCCCGFCLANSNNSDMAAASEVEAGAEVAGCADAPTTCGTAGGCVDLCCCCCCCVAKNKAANTLFVAAAKSLLVVSTGVVPPVERAVVVVAGAIAEVCCGRAMGAAAVVVEVVA